MTRQLHECERVRHSVQKRNAFLKILVECRQTLVIKVKETKSEKTLSGPVQIEHRSQKRRQFDESVSRRDEQFMKEAQAEQAAHFSAFVML